MIECHNKSLNCVQTHLATILEDCKNEKDSGGYPLVFVYISGRSI